jgi:hypothetical protein
MVVSLCIFMGNLLYETNDLKEYFADFFKGKSIYGSNKMKISRAENMPDFAGCLERILRETKTPAISFVLAVHLQDTFGNKVREIRKNFLALLRKDKYDDYFTPLGINVQPFKSIVNDALDVPKGKKVMIVGGNSGFSSGFENSYVLSVGNPDVDKYLQDHFRLGRPIARQKIKKDRSYFIPTFSVEPFLFES